MSLSLLRNNVEVGNILVLEVSLICVVDSPLLSKTGCLQDTKELGIVYFNMSSRVPSCLKMVVVWINCNHSSSI